ncbi:MAG: glycosyltransferase family protein [Bacteriovorax sp.]|jgi:uncharacterized protein (TIGR00661 family)
MITCAGLGMGNASRVCAIIEALHQKAIKENKSIEFHVLSWGAGHLFLKDYKLTSDIYFNLIKIQGYGNNKGLSAFIRNYLKNTQTIKVLIKEFNPDLLILDSDYHFLAYFQLNIPRISINQASDVLERIPLTNYRPQTLSEKLMLFCREELDSFFQKIISSKVLVPSFSVDSKGDQNDKRIKIPLIVREEFLAPKNDSVPNSIGVLLSGSEIDKDAFLKLKKEHNIQVITPGQDKTSLLSHAEVLDKFDIIFTQGGLSSISEVIAREKFLVVFPIHNHPEQIVNALEVERLGVGMKSSLRDLDDFDDLFKFILQKKDKARRDSVDCTGAQKAAEIMFHYFQ